MSFAVTPSASFPSTRNSYVFGRYCNSVCVARTCSTSLVPIQMPRLQKLRASPYANRRKQSSCGLGVAKFWSDDMYDPLIPIVEVIKPDPEFIAVFPECIDLLA